MGDSSLESQVELTEMASGTQEPRGRIVRNISAVRQRTLFDFFGITLTHWNDICDLLEHFGATNFTELQTNICNSSRVKQEPILDFGIKRSLSDDSDHDVEVMKMIPKMTKNKSKQEQLKREMKLESYRESNKKLKSQVQDLELKIASREDYVNQAKITVLQDAISGYQKNKNSLEEKLETVTEKNKNLRDRYDVLLGERNELMNIGEKVTDGKIALDGALAAANIKIMDLSTQVENLMKKNERLEKSLLKFEERRSQDTKNHEIAISEYQEKMLAKEKDHHQQLGLRDSVIHDLRKQSMQFTNTTAHDQNNRAQLMLDVSLKQMAINDLNLTVQRLNSELVTTKKQLTASDYELQRLTQIRERNSDTIETEMTEIARLHDVINKLTKELYEAQRTYELLQAKTPELSADEKQANKALLESTITSAGLLQNTLIEKTHQLKLKETRICMLEDALKKCEQEITDLKKKIVVLEANEKALTEKELLSRTCNNMRGSKQDVQHFDHNRNIQNGPPRAPPGGYPINVNYNQSPAIVNNISQMSMPVPCQQPLLPNHGYTGQPRQQWIPVNHTDGGQEESYQPQQKQRKWQHRQNNYQPYSGTEQTGQNWESSNKWH